MEGLLVGRRPDPEFKVLPILERVAVPLKKQIHSLWILLDPGQLLNKQVEAVVRNAFFQF